MSWRGRERVVACCVEVRKVHRRATTLSIRDAGIGEASEDVSLHVADEMSLRIDHFSQTELCILLISSLTRLTPSGQAFYHMSFPPCDFWT